MGRLPLVFNQHFTSNLDHWNPAVLDGLAKEYGGLAPCQCQLQELAGKKRDGTWQTCKQSKYRMRCNGIR